MHSRWHAPCCLASCLGLLALLLVLSGPQLAQGAYLGFDCSQGHAVLRLAHSQGCSGIAEPCLEHLALHVHRCGLKAWPNGQHKGRKTLCAGLQVVANVTDVNTAAGTLHLHGSSQPSMPVQLAYRRSDERMQVAIGVKCAMVYEVQSASEASLHPIPGEAGAGVSSLVPVLLPAILVPCVVVGLLLTAKSPAATLVQQALAGMGGATSSTAGGGGDDDGASGDADGGVREPLCGGAASSSEGGGGSSSSKRAHAAGAGLALLKAMSRRARSRRVRRSCRPTYVGLPEQSAAQHRSYVAGELEPGPFNLVAPYFRFPPIAVAPGLDAIPESNSPSSRASSTLGRTSPLSLLDDTADSAPRDGLA